MYDAAWVEANGMQPRAWTTLLLSLLRSKVRCKGAQEADARVKADESLSAPMSGWTESHGRSMRGRNRPDHGEPLVEHQTWLFRNGRQGLMQSTVAV